MLALALTAQLLAFDPTIHSAHLLETQLHLVEGQTPEVEGQPVPGVPPPGVQGPVLPWDPYANSFRGAEAGVGALGVLGVDFVSGAVLLGFILASGTNATLGTAVGAFLLVGLLDFALVPLAAAWGANLVSGNAPKAGSFTKSVLLAYGAELVGAIVFGVILAAVSNDSGAALVVELLDVAWHFVAIPIAASFGLHWGDSGPPPTAQPVLAPPAPQPYPSQPSPGLFLPSEMRPMFSIPLLATHF